MNTNTSASIFIGIFIFLGVISFFLVASLIKPSNPKEWGEFAKMLGVVLTFLATCLTAVSNFIFSNTTQRELANVQQEIEAMKIIFPKQHEAYTLLYQTADKFFLAARPLDNGSWNEQEIQEARQSMEANRAVQIMLRSPDHTELWKTLAQKAEFISGELKKREGKLEAQVEFWLEQSPEYAEKLAQFKNIAEEVIRTPFAPSDISDA